MYYCWNIYCVIICVLITSYSIFILKYNSNCTPHMTHLFLKESKRKFKVLQLNLVCISSLQRSYFPSQLPGMTRRLTPMTIFYWNWMRETLLLNKFLMVLPDDTSFLIILCKETLSCVLCNILTRKPVTVLYNGIKTFQIKNNSHKFLAHLSPIISSFDKKSDY